MLLVSGRFAVSQTIIPEAQEHFLTPSAHRDTHLFGGLGLRWIRVTLELKLWLKFRLRVLRPPGAIESRED